MKLYTVREQARTAAKRWKRGYFVGGTWRYGDDKLRVYENLVALGSDPLVEDVCRTIGNDSWTMLRCDECGEKVESAVEIGQEPDYDSSTALICQGCLGDAVTLIDQGMEVK